VEKGGCIRGGYRIWVTGCEEAGPGPDPEPGDYATIEQAEEIADAARQQAQIHSDAALDEHEADTVDVHGIADTSQLETQSGAQVKANAAQTDAEQAAADALAAHAADTTNVHGIVDTSQLLTQAEIDDLATTAELNAHIDDTTAVHGIADTSVLETQSGAQAKADAAQAAAASALSAHSIDTTAVHGIADTSALETQTGAQSKADAAESAAEATAAAALSGHAADTTDVHGIADTAALLTSADLSEYATDAELAAHATDTTSVHGIANTADLLTQADIDGLATEASVAAVQAELDGHEADTTAVHGIADTADLVVSADLDAYATDSDLAAHAADTTAVHGIADTSVLATDAEVATVQGNLDTHAADTTAVHGIADTSALETAAGAQAKVDAHSADTTGVHGITDTSQLLTDADLADYATDADLAAHAADTTAVHGIADTSLLETTTGAQAKADAAQAAAIADAVTKYLNRLTGGVVTGDLTVDGANLTVLRGDDAGGYRLRTTGGELDFEFAGKDLYLSRFAGADFTGDQVNFMRLEPGGTHLIGHTQLGTGAFDAVFDFDTAAAAATFTGDLTVTGVLNALGVTDWVNAKSFGAVGDGTADDTAELQAAIDATPFGGMCYIPLGDYRTSVPLVVPPGVTVMMPHSNMMYVPGLSDPPCRIRPLAAFTGDAVIVFLSEADGGYADISGEQRLINVMIDGAAYTATPLNGIQAEGNVQNIVMEGVTIRFMSGTGIYTGIGGDTIFPYSWRLYRVMSDNNAQHGFEFNVMTDITMFDCQAIGNHLNGFQLANLANSQMSLCRAEWNWQNGYNFTGDWGDGTGSGALVATGCSTDRNGYDGMHFECTGTTPIIFNGLMLRRDGRNNGTGGGGFSALSASDTTTPLIFNGISVFPGTDDGGAGTSSPEIGLKFHDNTLVIVDDAYVHVATTPIDNNGGNTRYQQGPSVVGAIGPTDAPVVVGPAPWTWRGTASATAAAAATDNILETRVAGEAFAQSVLRADGVRILGDGTGAPDTPGWYREVAGNLKCDSYVNMNAGGQAGGVFTSWAADAKALRAGAGGGGFSVAEGANCRMGESVLVGGTVTVANTSVTANTKIFLQRRVSGGTAGHLSYTRTAATSFTITSSSGSDTSTVSWVMVEPS
jgi:hypothetical protein